MGRLFSKADQRALGSVVALVLLLSTLPLGTGAILVSHSAPPELTVNICQPLQTFDRASNVSLAPSIITYRFLLFRIGSIARPLAVREVDRRVAPDTPPPRPFL
jgi:hypothetical protein